MLIIAYADDPAFVASAPADCQWDARLAQIDRWLDDPALLLSVTNDLVGTRKSARQHGRPSTPVAVTMRIAIARRMNDWSYRQAERMIRGSFEWRRFCGLGNHRCPDHSTLRDRECQIRPETLVKLNEHLVRLAQHVGVSTGQRLRADGSVIETHIHYPTDSSLLADSVRVLGRWLKTARPRCVEWQVALQPWPRNQRKAAANLARQISQTQRKAKRGPGLSDKAKRAYQRLVKLTCETVAAAKAVQQRLQPVTAEEAQALREQLAHYLPLVQRVITQTTRRVEQGESVPAAEKIVSIFEPHTAIIQRGKAKPHETEFGRKVWYAESDGGLITSYQLLVGNPPESPQWLPSIETHRRLYGHAPREATADRGVYSEANVREARAAGVKRVALPQPGAKSPTQQQRESQPWFRALLRWRNGIEGRISQLRRARGLDRCLNRGESGMLRWLGWGVIANNLLAMAQALMPKPRRKRARA